ncbi:MAG: hypothetical protein Unbinned5607contig1000_35 [Prokaryotic dsDNA virus sp.]|nr:MAG: hypothetical protein Unbinned5607contig1000_35 [Prokaryotic dsDNA virus sp.]|tara:strand:+ start:14037 stop:14390 length:354 start_codon:yes stop_codon:yes gene_type:complete
MIVLTTSALSQDFKFIPRTFASAVDIEIHDEDTNTTETYLAVVTNTDRYYEEASVTFSPVLKEGTFYNLTVYSTIASGNVIYKDRIFCTDQNINEPGYSINEGEYNEHVSENEYIVL